jgi:hypothetical protein
VSSSRTPRKTTYGRWSPGTCRSRCPRSASASSPPSWSASVNLRCSRTAAGSSPSSIPRGFANSSCPRIGSSIAVTTAWSRSSACGEPNDEWTQIWREAPSRQMRTDVGAHGALGRRMAERGSGLMPRMLPGRYLRSWRPSNARHVRCPSLGETSRALPVRWRLPTTVRSSKPVPGRTPATPAGPSPSGSG